VTAMDVVYALKRQGRTIYGFGGWFHTVLYSINSVLFRILLVKIKVISFFLLICQ
jgi:hypothetical protein